MPDFATWESEGRLSLFYDYLDYLDDVVTTNQLPVDEPSFYRGNLSLTGDE